MVLWLCAGAGGDDDGRGRERGDGALLRLLDLSLQRRQRLAVDRLRCGVVVGRRRDGQLRRLLGVCQIDVMLNITQIFAYKI